MSRRSRPCGAGGFSYLGVMFLTAMLALTSASAAVIWQLAQRRDKEAELLFVGQQFKLAIERWRQRGGEASPWPASLEQLLADPRSQVPVRHLRRLYPDPFTGRSDWGLLRDSKGGIVGVFSQAEGRPIRRANFPPGLSFAGARRYRDWKFIAQGAAFTGPSAAAAAAGADPAESPTQSEPPEEEEQAWPSPVRIQEDLLTQDSEACARIIALDQRICQSQRQLQGEQAGADCDASALVRARTCGRGNGSLPALYLAPG